MVWETNNTKNEITIEDVPSIKRVENWIAVYTSGLSEAAAERCSNFEKSSGRRLGHRHRDDFIQNNDHENFEYQSNV
ncbi:2052_t:CDS:2 [Gigaspora margarita]|uniref:2052_t:CDS:1 n=1 Tax=Gigaspora margarita TaxID=4874 RepID=A0ABN7U7Q6_GIGMA|nr:2052_t:CDS:2 [Gigaspora margarita]